MIFLSSPQIFQAQKQCQNTINKYCNFYYRQNQQQITKRMILLRWYRSYFSVINKIKKRQKIKNPPHQRKITKPHEIGDIVSTISYESKKLDLSPYQQYLIQSKSMQRPFTGNLWGEISAGFYHCVVCNTRLFTFDQKIKDQFGFAAFYDCVEKRVKILEQKANFVIVNLFSDHFIEQQIKRHKRCQCNQCQSHIGAVLFNGPHPTFLRFLINSQALVFKEMEDFIDPNIVKKAMKIKRESQEIKQLQ